MVSTHDLAKAVRATFNRVATAPSAGYRFAVGREYARAAGYPAGVLDALPPETTAAFTGLTYLLPQLRLAAGERVLDLGCGGGLDSALIAGAVAPGGVVYGVDLSEDMVARARRAATALRLLNARFLHAAAEALPIASGVTDVVVANGFLNLCPNKAAVVTEVARVLRPGGRAVFAEITFGEVRPSVELRTADDWFRWLAGALPEAALKDLFRAAGLQALGPVDHRPDVRSRAPDTYVAVITMRRA